ncbi:MAG: PDGLE domain-containing protein [Candidatus Bathycorpusculaceae bacterium]
MKGYFKSLIFILVFLAILIPFASESPDGLERVVETLGVEEHEPVWSGFMPDYSLPAVENSYASTLLAGVFGTLLVLGISYTVGMAITKKDAKSHE